MDIELFDYSPIVEREPIWWPNGARVAFYVGLNVEHFYVNWPSTSLNPATAELVPDALIAHFSHTSMAGPTYFRMLPAEMRDQLLRGMLGADVLGFHSTAWAENFLLSARQLPGVRVDLARSRILVERAAYDRFVELLVEATRGVRVGDPADEATEMGPLISAAHRDKVSSFVDSEPFFRGEAPDGRGFWFPCTLVEATNEDRVAREEVFGPVAAVIPFADEADAIRISNDTPYGLSGSIWTRDGARALRVARALDTGVLSVNSNSSVRVATPFGGFKQSGFGREMGIEAMDSYLETKSVVTGVLGKPVNPFGL